MRRAARIGAWCLGVLLALPGPALAGDLDGDGRADILWRHTSGLPCFWSMDGVTVLGVSCLDGTSAEWSIVALADFDADGTDDLLWRHAPTGATYAWLMSGGTVHDHGYTSAQADVTWVLTGVGDTNADGRSDLVWSHPLGVHCVWLMSGLDAGVALLSGAVPAPGWSLAGVGDFDGDGRADLLWREPGQGQTILSFLDGAAILDTRDTTPWKTIDWAIRALGDANGDGRDDVLWHHATGAWDLWLMNGTELRGSGDLGIVNALVWEVVTLEDFNADGCADLLWRDSETGATYVWLLEGTDIGVWAPVTDWTTAQADGTWTVQAP